MASSLSIEDNEQVLVEERKELGSWQKSICCYAITSLSIEDNDQVLVKERKELGNWQKYLLFCHYLSFYRG